MPPITPPSTLRDMPSALIANMITLATSGFGVVVALAWNEVIQKAVAEYIDPLLGKGSGLASMFIYAIVMTFLAVTITMQLSFLQRKLKREEVSTSSKKSKKSIKK
jgi:K+-transporting ATPase A subunit